MEECVQCRIVFEDVNEICAQWLPEYPAFKVPRDEASEQRLRKAILARVSRQGGSFSKAAQSAGHVSKARIDPWRIAPVWVAIGAITVFALVAALSRFAGVRMTAPQKGQGPSQSIASPIKTERASASTEDRWRLEARLSDDKAALERALRSAQAGNAVLRRQLNEEHGTSVVLAQDKLESTRTIVELQQQLELSRAKQANTETELAKLQSVQETNESVSIAQQQEIRELTEKLAEQAAAIDRETQLLSAGRDIRDLIAARNLHIIDVYDTDSRGKTNRAFGRVFYTEGKSLVFYAYDLTSKHSKAGAYAFYVWGKKDGEPHLARNLGLFSIDGKAQQRWVLTITDPKILAEIDSVFVTVEPTDQKRSGQPTGKPLLSAFLGTPANHP